MLVGFSKPVFRIGAVGQHCETVTVVVEVVVVVTNGSVVVSIMVWAGSVVVSVLVPWVFVVIVVHFVYIEGTILHELVIISWPVRLE